MQLTYMGYNPDNNFETIQIIRDGLPIGAYEHLKQDLSLADKRIAEITNISLRTITKRKREGKLSQDETEKITRIARVYNKAIETFNAPEKARRWMNAPLAPLGGKTPLEMCGTEPGAAEAEKLLLRIIQGVYS